MDLICLNCNQEFNLSDRLPKLLECNRNLCLKCLNTIKKSRFSSKFKCLPDKKHKHKRPKHGFQSLPNVDFIIILLKFQRYNKELDDFEKLLNSFRQISVKSEENHERYLCFILMII